LQEIFTSASFCGLTVSLPKTKGLTVGAAGDDSPVVVRWNWLEILTYLGSKLSSNGGITFEVGFRIDKGSKAFGSNIS